VSIFCQNVNKMYCIGAEQYPVCKDIKLNYVIISKWNRKYGNTTS